MKFYKTHWALTAGALALSLALAGCGGGSSGDGGGLSNNMMQGGDSQSQMMPGTPATPETEAHVCDDGATKACIDAREDERDEAKEALDAVEADETATVGDLNEAKEALEAAQEAFDEANTAAMEMQAVSDLIDAAETAVSGIDADSTPKEVAEGSDDIDAAQKALDEMENLFEADKDTLQARINMLEQGFDPIADMVTTKANTMAAETKETAIAAEGAQTTDDGPGGEGATNDHAVVIARDDDGTTVTVTVDGAASDDPEFVKAEDLTSTSNPGQMLTRTMDADANGDVVEEVVGVYTDIEAPTPTAFAMVTGQALNARDLDPAVDADDNGTPTDDYTALTVALDAATYMLVKSSFFPPPTTGSSSTHNFNFDDTATTEMDEADEVEGTYNDAPGTFRCDGTSACSVTVDDEGDITAMTGTWVFTPNAGAMSPVPDADYLHYGFWLKRTKDDDGNIEYNEVETFAGSMAPESNQSDLGNVDGIATYKGGAAGVYVKNVFDPKKGVVDTATSGHFTANADLTAYFDGGNTPANKANQFTGTIDSFMLSGPDKENDWSVTLEDANLTDGLSGMTMVDDAAAGVFNATFHGDIMAVDHDNDPVTPDVNPHPGSVVGEFDAVFSNGSVAGAFGARKQQ